MYQLSSRAANFRVRSSAQLIHLVMHIRSITWIKFSIFEKICFPYDSWMNQDSAREPWYNQDVHPGRGKNKFLIASHEKERVPILCHGG